MQFEIKAAQSGKVHFKFTGQAQNHGAQPIDYLEEEEALVLAVRQSLENN